MKKYVKPELFYEHFELSTHIADCMFEYVNGGDTNTCQFKADENSGMDGKIVFATEAVCGVDFEGPTCYFPGTDGAFTTFAS